MEFKPEDSITCTSVAIGQVWRFDNEILAQSLIDRFTDKEFGKLEKYYEPYTGKWVVTQYFQQIVVKGAVEKII